MRKWLLPEAIEDVLPVEAARVEALRRALLDHFRAHGYRLVLPPLVEHLDSLLTGTGRDLDLQTFKMVDPLSGRMLGLARRHHAAGRADRRAPAERDRRHAPLLCRQRAAHRAGRTGRHARGRADRRRVVRSRRHRRRPRGDAAPAVGARRAPASGGLHLDLGHVGVYRALARAAGLDATGEGNDSELFDALRDKDFAGRARTHRRRCRSARATRCARWPACTARADATLAAARDVLPALPGSRGGARRVGEPRRRRRAVSMRSTSTSPTCAAITTTRAPRSRCSRRATAARSSIAAAAAATMASAARSAARARPPASRWTCGASRRWPAAAMRATPIAAPDDPDPALARADAHCCDRAARRSSSRLPGEADAGAPAGATLERHGGEWRVVTRNA